MPIYEYRCEACGHTLDALQKVSDEPLSSCPSCSEPALKRLISAPSFRLKGSGWYETDFKSDKDKRRNLAESAKADAGDKPKDDAKPKAGSEGGSTGGDKPKPPQEKKKGKSTGSEAA